MLVAACITIFMVTLIFSQFSDQVAHSGMASFLILGSIVFAVLFSVLGLIQFRMLQNKGVAIGGYWIYMTTLGLTVMAVIILFFQILTEFGWEI